MDKNKKFAFIWLFTTAVKMEKTFDQRVLVATTAAHIGTKQPLFNHVLRVGLPWCRRSEMAGMFLVYTDWKLFVQLLLSILIPPKKEADTTPEHNLVNSIIP